MKRAPHYSTNRAKGEDPQSTFFGGSYFFIKRGCGQNLGLKKRQEDVHVFKRKTHEGN